jgi:uncharacterized protein (DUF488 family)
VAQAIYTLGYQGLSLDEYISLLKEHPIRLVIDVRAVAWSHKPGFAKSAMQSGLRDSGIDYLHLQSAGNPFRKDEDGENVMMKYRAYLQKHPEPLDRIEVEIQQASKNNESICLTCFEKAPQDCHRSIIAEQLLTRNPRLHVIHLGAKSDQLSLMP